MAKLVYPNSPVLRQWLREAGFAPLAGKKQFALDREKFEKALEEVRTQHPNLGRDSGDRAALRLLTLKPIEDLTPIPKRWVITWAVLVVVLLSAILARGQTSQLTVPCKATTAAPTLAEGARVPCSTDLSGATRVSVISGGGGGVTDNSTFTGGSSTVSTIGALYDTTPPLVTDGSVGAPRMNSSRILLVDGSGATQPVSGTVAATQSGAWTITANAGTNLNTSLLALESGGNLATLAGTVTSSRIAVNPISGQSGVQGGSGTVTTTTQRVVLATDVALPAGTNNIGDVDVLTLPSVTVGTFPDNEPFNLAQVNGGTVTTVATGTQKVGVADSAGAAFLSAANALNSTGSGIQTAQAVGQFDDTSPTSITENQFGNVRMSANRNVYQTIRDAAGNERGVNVTSTNDAQVQTNHSGATAATVPARASYVGGQGSGNLTGITVCDAPKTISVTADTQLVTGTANKHIYICSINLVVAAATNVAIVSGTGSTCGTGTGGVFGGTTAATGWNLAANGGIAQGSGIGWIGRSVATGDNLCILVSAANQTSGAITYTVQ